MTRNRTVPAAVSAARVAAIALTAGVLAPALALRADEPVELRHRIEPGVRAQYRLTLDTDVTFRLDIPAFNRKWTAGLHGELEWAARATRKDADGGRVAVRPDRIAVKGTLQGNDVRFDSHDKVEPTEATARILRAAADKLLGREIGLELASDGRLTKAADLMEPLREALRELGLPVAPDAIGRLDDTTVAAVFARQAWPMLPAGKVKPGDTWTETLIPGPEGRPALVETVYTLRAVETVDGRRIARIKVAVKPDPAALALVKGGNLPLPKLQGLEPELTLQRFESDGELSLLVEDGTLLASKLDTRLEFSAGVTFAAGRFGVSLVFDGRHRVDRLDKPEK